MNFIQKKIRREVFVFLLSCLLFLVFNIFECFSDEGRIAIVTTAKANKNADIVLLSKIYSTCPDFKPVLINLQDLLKNPSTSKTYKLLWVSAGNDKELQVIENSIKASGKSSHSLMRILENGCNVVLSGYAVNLINEFGINGRFISTKASDIIAPTNNEIGMMAFVSHPLFDGIGAWCPMKNAADGGIDRFLYDQEIESQDYHTIAVEGVDAEAIPQNQLVMEFQSGQGRLITFNFNGLLQTNSLNRDNVHKIVINTAKYLTKKCDTSFANYWQNFGAKNNHYDSQSSKSMLLSNQKVDNTRKSHLWKTEYSALQSDDYYAKNVYWNLTGDDLWMNGSAHCEMLSINSYPYSALKDMKVGIELFNNSEVYWLLKPYSVVITPESITRLYKKDALMVKEVITVDRFASLAVFHYEISSADRKKMLISFVPEAKVIFPGFSTGNSKGYVDSMANVYVNSSEDRYFNYVIGSSKRIRLKDYSKNSSMLRDTNLITLTLDAGMDGTIDVVYSVSKCGLQSAVDACYQAMLNPWSVLVAASLYYDNLLDKTLSITTPDKKFNDFFKWSIVQTDKQYNNVIVNNANNIIEKHKSYYGRNERFGGGNNPKVIVADLMFHCISLLDCGQYDKVHSQLDFLTKYQKSTGRIPSEVSSQGIVKYESIDATLLFVTVAGRYLRHSGDMEFIERIFPNVIAALQYLYSRDIDKDSLLEYGDDDIARFDTLETDESIYLNSIWAATLGETAYLAHNLKSERIAGECDDYFEAVKRRLNKVMSLKSTDGINTNSDQNISNDDQYKKNNGNIYNAVALAMNVSDPINAGISLRNLLGWDYSDAGNKPQLLSNKYCDANSCSNKPAGAFLSYLQSAGCFNYQKTLQGHSLLKILSNDPSFSAFPKYLPQKDNINNNCNINNNSNINNVNNIESLSNPLSTHSMFLYGVAEGMLGLDVSAPDRTIRFMPSFPQDYDSATVENIRCGSNLLNFKYLRSNDKLYLSFNDVGSDTLSNDSIMIDFSMELPAGVELFMIRNNAPDLKYELIPNLNSLHLNLIFMIKGRVDFELEYSGGIAVLPTSNCSINGLGDESIKIVEAELQGNEYKIILESLPGANGLLRIYSNKIVEKVEGASILNVDGKVYTLTTDFSRNMNFPRKVVKVFVR